MDKNEENWQMIMWHNKMYVLTEQEFKQFCEEQGVNA